MTGKGISPGKEANVWIKQKTGPDMILRVVPALEETGNISVYHLYTAFDGNPNFKGAVLFDSEGYWIYDGNKLSIDEQEQVARFIIHYEERL